MFEMSDSIKELATALSKTQAKLESAVRDKDNLDFNARYSSLSAIWAACRGTLGKNGLSVVQLPGDVTEHRVHMTSLLMHSSGQWIRQELSIPITRLDPQGYGSAISYARRYALAALIGICPADDDINVSRQTITRPTEREPFDPGCIDNDQHRTLTRIATDDGVDLITLCEYLAVPSLRDLPASQYQAALLALQQESVKNRRAA